MTRGELEPQCPAESQLPAAGAPYGLVQAPPLTHVGAEWAELQQAFGAQHDAAGAPAACGPAGTGR